jgi:hypothetical protein
MVALRPAADIAKCRAPGQDPGHRVIPPGQRRPSRRLSRVARSASRRAPSDSNGEAAYDGSEGCRTAELTDLQAFRGPEGGHFPTVHVALTARHSVPRSARQTRRVRSEGCPPAFRRGRRQAKAEEAEPRCLTAWAVLAARRSRLRRRQWAVSALIPATGLVLRSEDRSRGWCDVEVARSAVMDAAVGVAGRAVPQGTVARGEPNCLRL